MKKLPILLITLLASSLLLFGCSSPAPTVQPSKAPDKVEDKAKDKDANKTSDSKVIRVGLDPYYKPMEYLEGDKPAGFSVDLMNAIGKKLGKEVKFVQTKWDDIFTNLNKGDYDIISSSVSITEDRKGEFEFSKSYFTSKGLILSKKSSNIKTAKDLVGKTVSVQDLTTTSELIEKKLQGVKIVKKPNLMDSLDEFGNGKAEAVVGDLPAVLGYVKEKKNPEYTIVEDPTFFPIEEFGYVAKKGNTAITTELNKAIKESKDSGEYQQIYDKYFK